MELNKVPEYKLDKQTLAKCDFKAEMRKLQQDIFVTKAQIGDMEKEVEGREAKFKKEPFLIKMRLNILENVRDRLKENIYKKDNTISSLSSEAKMKQREQEEELAQLEKQVRLLQYGNLKLEREND